MLPSLVLSSVFSSVKLSFSFAASALDPARLLVALAPDAKALASLVPVETLVEKPNAFVVGTHAAYLWCPDGFLSSKAGEALLSKAGRQATTRNWAKGEVKDPLPIGTD